MCLKRFLIPSLLFVIGSPISKAAEWVNMERHDDVLYFFVSSPAAINRYDISDRAWLPSITLPSARGAVSSGTVDADGIYVAYDKAVYRYNAAGANETHLLNAAGNVQGLFTDGNLLLVNHSISLYAKLTTVSKTTNTIISTFENYIDAVYGASISRGQNRLFGTSRGISPADVTYVEYTDAGNFVSGGDSPHHGDYSIGSRTWVFPGGNRFVDTTGNVYSTSNLAYSLSFGATIEDITFLGSDVPIVLSNGKVIAYTNAFLPAGSRTLSAPAKNIVADGDSVIAFRPGSGADILTEIVPLSSLNAPQPGQPVNPTGVAYVPDDAFVDRNGILHLLSKAHQTIFRWNPATQSYTTGIPLLGSPDHIAYSSATHTLYTAYTSGLVRNINLDDTQLAEVPFAQLPSAPRGLATAGSYLFACDGSGAWNTHYTYSPAGVSVSSKDWNYYSRSYVWNEVNQKMYFFRDDTSPNDLLWEEINANGTAYPTLTPGALGTTKDSPLHGDVGFTHPIRPSDDGTVVALGGGVLHNGTTLARLATTVGNSFADASWDSGILYSIRSVSGVSQLQKWLPPTYGQTAVAQIPGTPRRFIRLSSGTFVALVSDANGRLIFHVVDNLFNTVAPEILAAPANPVATVKGTSQIEVTWMDVGGEASYLIERRTSPQANWQTAGTTTANVTTFTDNGVATGSSYYYRITAINGPKTSAPSDEASIDFTLPSAPTPVATSLSASQIRIDWSAVTGATSYRLYRKLPSSSTWTLVTSPASTVLTYTNSSLSAGTTYQYKLQAVNALGSSADSSVVSATTSQLPPETPYLYSPSASGPFSVWISWSAYQAETYHLERQTGTSTEWVEVAVIPGNTSSYLDSGLVELTTYRYRLRSKNSAGQSGYSTTRSVTTPDIPLPSAPEYLTVDPVAGPKIALAWYDSSEELGYKVERQTGESAWVEIATLPADTTHYEDSEISAGTYYGYRIVAFNVRGSTTSSEVRIQAANVGPLVIETFDPSATYAYWAQLSGASVVTGPQGFHSGNALWMGGNGLRQVTLAGLDLSMGGILKFQFRAGNTAVDGATRWDNSESGEAVILEFSVNNGPWTYLEQLETQHPFHSSWESHEIALPSEARSSSTRFRWRQLQHSGASFDTWAIDDLEIKGVLPELQEAPPFVMGTANSSRVVALSWVAGSGATSYIVERRTPSSNWQSVGSAEIGQTYFVDETALPATLYSYRVIAKNASGESPPSNYILVTTWSTLAEWRFQNYGTFGTTGAAASLADNGTGIPNIVRFAFNMAASDQFYHIQNQGSDKGLPNIQMHSPNGLLRIAFIRRRAESNPGIHYAVEFSDNASAWKNTGHEVITAPIDENFEYVVWEDETAAPAKPIRFARVRVTE